MPDKCSYRNLLILTPSGEFSALKEVLGESGQRDVVNNLLRKITVLQNAVASSDATRRRLHNELVQVKGNVSSEGWLRIIAWSAAVSHPPRTG